MEANIQEIQELYMDEETKKEGGRVEDDEVILIKLYEASTTTSSSNMSFITEEVEHLLKYMKFIRMPSQTRLFKPPPHY